MASAIFALLDDIASLMDDVASMSKIATQKTAGILGDDLAVNAEKAMGFVSSREIPVLWAITKGSFLNKLIILPIAFILSAVYPPAIIVVLVFGGLYLAYEGAHKIVDFFKPKEKGVRVIATITPTEEEILFHEKSKIKAAIRTDFILSIEIVIIALGTVTTAALVQQIIVVSIVALAATVGVYGIVALIVRMDDFGYALIKLGGEKQKITTFIGQLLVKALPWIIKSLNVIGTVALLLVAGGIFAHNIDFFHHIFGTWPPIIKEFLIGLVIGFAVLAVVTLVIKLWKIAKR